jgi:alpha-amylase/alpha-mannosidase (GH57 family)
LPSPSTTRYLCIHGHFYQPPRENPWLEAVETQDSAAPFHDWNERVTAECYAPNGASRVLNERKKIIRIVNNYARISFNFGPTLLSWLEENAPRVYRGILDADRLGAQRFSGHGPAMAQVYNHIILPLANQQDRVTQIRWGIADFVRRFGREPEGMWLAETAVDRDSLDLLAQHGIRFVVLAPSQCRHVRQMCDPDQAHLPLDGHGPAGHDHAAPWQPVNAASLETRRPYRIPLDHGRSIAAFFYDGKISQAVAFENLLSSGDNFAARLLSGFAPAETPQLVHIATDGESYGHHHRHGEMALSYALDKIQSEGSARLTVYGEYLSLFPPQWEAEVNDNTSWSCFHGIERWRSDCGCSSHRAGWNQQWRTPLRLALDQLRDAIIPLSEELAVTLLRAPRAHAPHDNPLWTARDAYISVVLDRSQENVDRFLAAHARHPDDASAQTAVLSLMELQRHALLMFTSCGWFFDDISGIETVQVLAYAGRVLQLAAALFGPRGEALEAPFLAMLAKAHSNLPDQADGATLYRNRIRPQSVDLVQVAAHYAIRSLFPDAANPGRNGAVFAYDVHRQSHETYTSGRAQLAIGQADVRSRLTREQQRVEYAVLHFGDQNLSAAVRPVVRSAHRGDLDAFTAFAQDTAHAFQLGNLPEVVRLTDRAMGQASFSLHSLFADEQRRILDQLLARTLQEVETGLWNIHVQHQSLLHFLADAGMPQPPALRFVAEFVTSASLHRALETDPVNLDEVRSLLARISTAHIALDTERLRFAATQSAKRALVAVQHTARRRRSLQQQASGNTETSNGSPAPHNDLSDLALREASAAADLALDRALSVVEAVRLLPLEPNFWQAQNLWNQLWQEVREPSPKKTRTQKSAAKERPRTWLERFRDLGVLMDLAVDDISVEEPAAAAVS